MEQLAALVWLKWTLFRNAMRSRKAVLSRVASILGTAAALTVALLLALVLGVIMYNALSPGGAGRLLAQMDPGHPQAAEARKVLQNGFLFLIITLSLVYLMWATVPLSLGGGSQFTPGRFLLYPVSLSKLFAIDFMSEFTSLASIFAVPLILAVSLGAGLAVGNLLMALPVALLAVACGISIAKWLATSLSTIMQRRRSRGETMLALIGVVVALGGAFFGEFANYLMRYGGELKGLRWTPPGAVAVALTRGLSAGGSGVYALALLTLVGYTLLFVLATYFIARRTALGMGGTAARRTASAQPAGAERELKAGWRLPFASPQLSAVVEKELRYAMRNAQLRMMALMPMVLIVVRLLRDRRPAGRGIMTGSSIPPAHSFAAYTEGLLVAGGVLYVFLILSSLACNLFAYEGGGMRSLILAPVERRTILLGKNIAVATLAFLFAGALLGLNQIVFHDLTGGALLFASLSFLFFAASFALIGNWLSIRFPKRLQFGKRMNASGVTGLLLVPILLVLAAPPVLSVVAGYYAHSFAVKYVTLALTAAAATSLYFLLIARQGRALERHEQAILDAVSGRGEEI